MTDQKKKDLNYQHSSEMLNLEENYNREIVELNIKWDALFNELNEKAKKMEESLNIKQKNEMETLIIQLDEKISKQIKFSKEYLDLKQCEYNLVKQDRLLYLI